MRRRVLLLLMCVLPAFAGSHGGTVHAARCSPSGVCHACKNCRSCGHCAKGGGTCSVCRPSSTSSEKPKPRPRPTVEDLSAGVVEDEPVSKRCAAITKKGARCKRDAQAGGTYCWQHAR